MPFTIITLKRVPASLRGDLTLWMQEIATGVYVGNFSTRVRQYLWERVCNSVGEGEATLSFASRNEIGYDFQTVNANRSVVNSDGIPLVMVPITESQSPSESNQLHTGFSNASHMHHARHAALPSKLSKETANDNNSGDISKTNGRSYVAIDLETTGLHPDKDKIIEIGAVKWINGAEIYFETIININNQIPEMITKLTGITNEMVQSGKKINTALLDFLNFIGDLPVVGYNLNFDVQFLNTALQQCGMPKLDNKQLDLLGIVKKEQLFQENYKLETSLKSYGIRGPVPHRALADAKLIFQLSKKLNVFQETDK